MPAVVFPVLPDGLRVDVVIGLDRPATLAQLTAGQPVTAPVTACGEVDTGSNVTAVSTAILQRLGIPTHYQTTTQTAAGTLSVKVAKVSVGIRNLLDPLSPELVEPSLSVMALATRLPNVDVLIGLDFLLGCKFLLDGPGQWFSLES
jgi:hypothetical protein